MMVKVTSFVEGKDAALIERGARALCHRSGSNCYARNGCASRAKCRMGGWATYVDDVERLLSAIRETHRIEPKAAAKRDQPAVGR